MATAKFEVDYDSIKMLESRLKELPGNAEKVMNEVLHNEGAELLTRNITHLIPISEVPKKHARDANWSKTLTENLGFTIVSRGGAAKNKGSYGYLVFPDEGRGRSNPEEQDFTGRATEATVPQLLKLMHNKITTTLQEVF